MTRGWWGGVATAAALAAALTGCKPTIPKCSGEAAEVEPPQPPRPEYVLLEYNLELENATAPQVDKRETPKYAQVRNTVKKVAIRFPDSCLNAGAAAVTGVSNTAENILGTNCGTWLSEMERALSGAGFTVFSSDALVRLEREKGLSPYNAGKQLGADVVFILNSLEAGDITAGGSKQGTFRFYESDARAHRYGPKPLDPTTMQAFVDVAQSVLKEELGPKQVIALSSILDATAVLTESGESVWFYRRVVTFPVKESLGMGFLFGRYPEACSPNPLLGPELCQWRAVAPEAAVTAPVVVQQPALRSEFTVKESVGAGVDAYKAQRLELIRAGAKEFVSAFQGGAK